MRKSITAAAVLALTTVCVTPATAHHSFAMFDFDQVKVLKGTVKEFRWVNPHVALFLNVEDDDGAVWSVELTSPGNLKRLGWTRKTLQVGNEVEVEVNPLRDGRKGGGFRQVTIVETGQTLTARLRDLERGPGR